MLIVDQCFLHRIDGDNDHSIRVGIKESGPVIVAAALIMFSVFIAFVFQDDMQDTA
jgi:RND superfamily putative drug exporter